MAYALKLSLVAILLRFESSAIIFCRMVHTLASYKRVPVQVFKTYHVIRYLPVRTT